MHFSRMGIALFLAASHLSAQAGSVSGLVTDSASSAPIVGARVVVASTTAGTTTGDNGRYTLGGIAAGVVVLEFSRIGYAPKRISVTLSATEAATQDVALAQVTFLL